MNFKNKYIKLDERSFIFLFGILILLLTYSNAIANDLYNHDSVSRIYTTIEPSRHLAYGRLWRDLIDNILGVGMLPPKITLLITYVFMFLTYESISRIFEVINLRTKLVTLLIIITFPLFGIYYVYGTDIIYYLSSIYFATIAIENLFKSNYLYAIIFTSISLFGYQMSLSYETSLLIFVFLRYSLKNHFSFKSLIKNTFIIAIGALFYFIIWKLILILVSIDPTTYFGADSIKVRDIFASIPVKVLNSYLGILKFITGNFAYFNHNLIIKLSVAFISLLLLLIPSILKIKDKNRIITYYFLMFITPLFIFSSSFVIDGILARSEFGLLIFCLFPIIIILEENTDVYIDKFITWTAIIFIILNSNTINSILEISEKNVEIDSEITNNIYHDLITTTDYKPSDNVAFCGSIFENDNYNWNNEYPYVIDSSVSSVGPSFIYLINTYENEDDPMHSYYVNSYKLKLTSIFKRNGYDINVVYSPCQKSIDKGISYPDTSYITKIDNNTYEVNLGMTTK